MGDLRPISDAPKDGTRFLGLVGDDLVAMFWHPEFRAFCSRFNRMTLADGLTFADTGKNYQDHSPVTHEPQWWMPIVAAPLPASTEARDG